MTIKSRVTAAILALIIGLTLLFSPAGCGDDDDILGLATLELVSYRGSTHYGLVGANTWVYVVCTPESERPAKPVYVWTISFNGNFIEEVVHDSEPKTETATADQYQTDDDTKYSWPNSDDLVYKFTEAGTYTAHVDLYDYNEYTKDKSKAKILANFTHTIHCDNLRVSIKATPTENSREYTLQAVVENPKYFPIGYPVKWDFINESTGQSDTGPVLVTSPEYSLSETGIQEAVHQFQGMGNYRIVFTVSDHKGNKITSAETTVDVTQAFQIMVPEGPLKTGREYTFIARTDSPETLSDTPSYVWDFGDGSGIIIPYSNEATHVFQTVGTKTISLKVYASEEQGAPLLGSANVDVAVEASANHLIELHQMKHFALTFAVQHDYIEGMSGVFVWGWDSHAEVVWDGVNFSMEWAQYGHWERMTGQVSEDGTVIEKLKIRHEFNDSEWYELEIQNLPFWEDTMPDRFIVDIYDEDVQNYVVYFNSHRTAGYQWTDDARLYVQFVREF